VNDRFHIPGLFIGKLLEQSLWAAKSVDFERLFCHALARMPHPI